MKRKHVFYWAHKSTLWKILIDKHFQRYEKRKQKNTLNWFCIYSVFLVIVSIARYYNFVVAALRKCHTKTSSLTRRKKKTTQMHFSSQTWKSQLEQNDNATALKVYISFVVTNFTWYSHRTHWISIQNSL